MGFLAETSLPDSNAAELHLSHPTEDERVRIWTNTSFSWRDTLTLPVYLKESLYLTTVPLAKNGGLTLWILVDKSLPPDQRPILCSCESFFKSSLVSDSGGNTTDVAVHGIASVFCAPEYRGRGYAARMMTELAKELYDWQSDRGKCVGTVLYSDIGKKYYAKLGWQPNTTNSHLVFQPTEVLDQGLCQPILQEDLERLCERDEIMIRKVMATPVEDIRTRFTIIPDLDHMLWHIAKETFACQFLFSKVPVAKGAIAGLPGSQIWAIWIHRYYDHPDIGSPNNVLYILRLVVEDPTLGSEENKGTDKYNDQVNYLKAILQAAQAEAKEWKLDEVKLWNPTPSVQGLIDETGIEHVVVEREEESIASGYWYDENGNPDLAPEWLNNEHYAWL